MGKNQAGVINMKKLLLILFLYFGLTLTASAKIDHSFQYTRYETAEPIKGAFGLQLGVIYSNDFLKPTPVKPLSLSNTRMGRLIDLLADDIDYYDKGNEVLAQKKSPSYLTKFRLLLDQNKKTFQITGYSDEEKGYAQCSSDGIAFMTAIDRKYDLTLVKDSKRDGNLLGPMPPLKITSKNNNRVILISCEATKPVCDNHVFTSQTDCEPSYSTFEPFKSGFRLVVKYRDRKILRDYRNYVDEKALKDKNETMDNYDL